MANIAAALNLLQSAGVKPKAERSDRPVNKRRLNLMKVVKLFQDRGWIAEVTEHYVPFRKSVSNLFGCLNIVAVKASSRGVTGALVLQGSSLDHSFERIVESKQIVPYLAAKNRLVIALIDDFDRITMYEVTRQTLKTKGVIEFKP